MNKKEKKRLRLKTGKTTLTKEHHNKQTNKRTIKQFNEQTNKLTKYAYEKKTNNKKQTKKNPKKQREYTIKQVNNCQQFQHDGGTKKYNELTKAKDRTSFFLDHK